MAWRGCCATAVVVVDVEEEDKEEGDIGIGETVCVLEAREGEDCGDESGSDDIEGL